MTHRPFSQVPSGQSASVRQDPAGSATQRSPWHIWPEGQSLSEAHCGFGTHLLVRQMNPAWQSESWPHS